MKRFLLLFLAAFSPFCFCACPLGDLDGNCSVDLRDFVFFADSWLDDPGGPANLDSIGKVDLSDYAILAQHWEARGYPLLINELMANNKVTLEDPDEADSHPDWIEIYNSGTTPVNIGGMFLTDKLSVPRLWQIPTDAPGQTTIPGGGYLLFYADEDTAQGPRHADFKLSDGGEAVGFFDQQGHLIDSISFESQGVDESYGRYPNASAGWQKFANGTASPGWSNGGESADTGIVINEIMHHPGHDEVACVPEPIELEYIELYNTTTSVVDLDGWRLTDGVQFAIPGGTQIAAGGYLVIAANPTAFAAAYPGVVNMVGGWTGKLTNHGERITLVNALGIVIDTVHYCDEGLWAQRILGPVDYYHRGWEWSDAHDGGGRSLELLCTSVSNEYGSNWQNSQTNGGTPGRANSSAVSNAAPIILKTKHSPIVPASSQAVTVTCEIIDEAPSGVGVVLCWRVDTSTYNQSEYPTYNEAEYTTVTMLDDGAHGDGQADDGVYGAMIGAQADKAIIEFFVKAVDAAANSRTFPAPCDIDGQPQQVANCLYQVDNSFDLAALSAIGAKTAYYLIMTESERGRLADIGDEQSGDNNERYSKAQMNGTYISVANSTVQCRYGVGYRDRGSGSSGRPPNNFRINFRTDEPCDGVTEINCNSKSTYLQTAGAQLYGLAGLHTYATSPVRLFVNGSEPALTDVSGPNGTYGYYAAFIPYGREWLDQYVLSEPDDTAGNLYKQTDLGYTADFGYLGTDAFAYAAAGYDKSNNGSENDWSDLIQLTHILDTMKTAPDYAQQVRSIIDVEQWMRWFAMATLIGYNENGLATCRGEDYVLYRTGDTGRFQLLIHDLDTVLYVAHDIPPLDRSIFYHANRDGSMPQITRLFQEPEFVQIYYAQLWDLICHFYAAENFNPLLDQILKGWVPAPMLADMKIKIAQRLEQATLQIPLTFSIQSPLPVVGGYPQTTMDTAQLTGKANAVTTHSVYVNGVIASWNPITGDWSSDTISLLPGINRILVETYGTADNSGAALEKGTFDIWYDDGTESTISGTQSTRTLAAADGPWHVTGDIVIPVGVTVTVEPGTTLFFDNATGITVNGCLIVHGTKYQRVRLTRLPGQSRWDGISFSNTLADNRLEYGDMEDGDQQGKSVNVEQSKIVIDNMTWISTNSNTEILSLSHPSAIIRNCITPTISAVEPIHGSGLVGSEYLIFEGNTFGATSGYNDIVDFSGGRRPGPIIQFYNNLFMGGGDDALDLDSTDTHVEGNLFKNFHQTPGQASTSNGVATDGGSKVCVVRNTFLDMDHTVLLKNDAYSWTASNTIINATVGAISFGEPYRSPPPGPGRGTYLDSNIFWNNAAIFDAYFEEVAGYGPTGSVGVYRSLLPQDQPAEWTFLRDQNIDADPILDNCPIDRTLLAGSAAIGTGANGLDMGADVPAGASVSGEPEAVTHRTTATLTVAGPGITHYKYRLVDNGTAGAWSAETALPINADNFPADPGDVYGRIYLTGLQNGHSYRVEVLGKNTAGHWQGQRFGATDFIAPGNPAGNSSHTWTVDTSSRILRINEVLASNTSIVHAGTYPDMIELYYDGSAPLDLGGYRLTDNVSLPDKFIFAQGTLINPGDYLVVYAGPADGTSGIHTGFAIDADGDDLTLADPAGTVIDSVVFGRQLADFSIGRIRYEKQWALTDLTLGTVNRIAGVGDWRKLKINEWLASQDIVYTEDRLEIYNPSPWPVDMGGLHLTDNPVGWPDRHRIRPLSYIAAKGFAVFIADGSGDDGMHLNFKLDSAQETLALLDSDLNHIDQVVYFQQKTDVSQGRMPDGGDQIGFFELPTLGATNPSPLATEIQYDLIEMTDVWSYEQSGSDLGTAWRLPGYADSAWPAGAALLYVEGATLPAPKNTPLSVGSNKITFYFRKHFTFSGNPAEVDHLVLTTVLDDGAVIYLNGDKILQIRLNDPVNYSTLANKVDNAVPETFQTPATSLVNGDNVIAVEVHQHSPTSTDIVWGLDLDAIGTSTTENPFYADTLNVLKGLRITEIMYHPASDPNAEYIELHNISSTALSLEGVRFTEGVDFVFPPMTLDPGQYTVVVADRANFESRYGTQVNIAGQYSGMLDNGGEQIVLKLADPPDGAVMRFEYKDGWYPTTDGGGYSLVIADPAGPLGAWRDAENWRPSTMAGGSPGRQDIPGVMINEVLAHSHDAAPDWIELYNPTSVSVNIGGWYLSDDTQNIKKYMFAEDTILRSGEYLVLYEDVHFNNPVNPNSLVQFALSEYGDEVYLSSGTEGELTGYTVEAAFGASETGVSFGRYAKSDQTTVFVLMDSCTPEDDNSSPKVGPIVISELMYNPPSGGAYPAQDYEFIELHNISASPVTLDIHDSTTGETLGWRFVSGIDFRFPLGTTIPAGGYLIVAKNPTAFIARYGNIGVAVLGPFANSTNLSNGGELVTLSKPGDRDLQGQRYYIQVDSVLYDDEAPWPASPDGMGMSLNRVDGLAYGNDVINWQAKSPAPGQ